MGQGTPALRIFLSVSGPRLLLLRQHPYPKHPRSPSQAGHFYGGAVRCGGGPADRRAGLPAVDERIDLIQRRHTDGRCDRHERSAPASDHAVALVLRQRCHELAGGVEAVLDTAVGRRVEAGRLTQAVGLGWG